METKVHKCRFYNPKPKSIECLAYNRNKKVFAIGRKEASIEIWDLNESPLLLAYIPGVENGSVEALAWSGNRLFSTGIGGYLVEWDLINLSVKQSVALTGYAAWCLDVDPENNHVVVGTEQGYINKFSIENNEITYSMLFDKQEGRIMCCKFDKSGNVVVTGSVNTIRVWNALTGQAVKRISSKRKRGDVIIWCLEVLSDLTIISGDSHGRLSFWDGNHGQQIESFPTFRKDILSLTVDDNEKSLYCSGLDSIIVNFVNVATKENTLTWVKNIQRHVHEHDVRGLLLQENKLLSVGGDGYLTFSSYPPKWVMRMPPMLPAPRSSVCVNKKLLVLKYDNYLEVWKLGTYMLQDGEYVLENPRAAMLTTEHKNDSVEEEVINSINMDNMPKPLKTATQPCKLAKIKSPANKHLKCFEFSPDGAYILYSTDSRIRIMKLEMDDDCSKISIIKIPMDAVTITTCERAAFTDDSESVIICSQRILYVLQIDAQTGASVQQIIPTEEYFPNELVLHLTVRHVPQSGTTYLVAADTAGAISVWTRRNDSKFEHYVCLPKYQCVTSAILVNHVSETLYSVYVNHKIMEYDLRRRKVLPWTSSLTDDWYKRTCPVTAMHLHPKNRDQIILEDYNSISVITKPDSPAKKSIDGEPRAKKSDAEEAAEIKLKVIPVKYISAFHWVGDDEAVIVEMLPEAIVSQLPPVHLTKKY